MLLHTLSVSSNNFTVTFSSNMSKLKYSKHIDISNNLFYGAIESLSIGGLKHLEHLDMHCNNSEGSVNIDDNVCLLRIYNKDNSNVFGKMIELKDLAADFLLIDECDEADHVDIKDANKEKNEYNVLARFETI